MPLVNDPDEIIVSDPASCSDCGADLAGAPVSAMYRRQVTDVIAPPPPRITEYQILTRTCPCCAATQTGPAPTVAPARAQYGPGVLARAAELLCGHYLPVARATALMGSMLGISVSTGFMAGVRGRAARLVEAKLLPRVRDLLRQAAVLHVDETPARADGGLEYVHVACTEFLTAMHTGGRSKADIDAGQVLPGYRGTIVRDGYAGYVHLIDAHHARCGAHYPDSLIIPMWERSVLVSGGSRAVAVGIITALRGRRASVGWLVAAGCAGQRGRCGRSLALSGRGRRGGRSGWSRTDSWPSQSAITVVSIPACRRRIAAV